MELVDPGVQRVKLSQTVLIFMKHLILPALILIVNSRLSVENRGAIVEIELPYLEK